MTPLAQEMLRFSLESSTEDLHSVVERLPRSAFFECTDVADTADDFIDAIERLPYDKRPIAVMPFPLTWIEFLDEGGGRNGYMLEATYDEDAGCDLVGVTRALSFPAPDRRIAVIPGPHFYCSGGGQMASRSSIKRLRGEDEDLCAWLFGCLHVISAPRGVARREEPPPERRLRRAFSKSDHPFAGSALPGWSRITLSHYEQSPSPTSGHPRESGVALHRVRSHLRTLRDRVTIVQAHDRGDAAFGIRRSFYDVNA